MKYGQKNSFFLVAFNKRVSEGALLWAFLPDMAVLVLMGFFPVGCRCSPTAVEPALGLFSVPRPRIASQVSVFLSQGLSPHPLLCACVCVPSSLPPPSLLPLSSLPPSLPPSSSWDRGYGLCGDLRGTV